MFTDEAGDPANAVARGMGSGQDIDVRWPHYEGLATLN
jgi:hypothetical protein